MTHGRRGIGRRSCGCRSHPLSVALALSLPAVPERSVLLAVTYVVVCFSIIGQGLTIGPWVARLYPDRSTDR